MLPACPLHTLLPTPIASSQLRHRFESNHRERKAEAIHHPSVSAKRHTARDQKILEHRTEQRVTEKVRDLNSQIVLTTCMKYSALWESIPRNGCKPSLTSWS